MKKLTLLVCAATMLTPAAIAHAQPRPDRDGHRQVERHDRSERYRHDDRYDRRDRDGRPQWRSWKRGDRFDRRYARDYVILDYRRYRALRPPPRGHHYVRSGHDAILVANGTGIVRAVIRNAVR